MTRPLIVLVRGAQPLSLCVLLPQEPAAFPTSIRIYAAVGVASSPNIFTVALLYAWDVGVE